MSARTYWLGLVSGVLLISGCGTYMEAKEATRRGGTIDQQKAAASQQLAAEKSKNTQLQDEQLNREREIARMDKRIQAAQAELANQNEVLNNALRSKKINQARYDDLKRQQSALQAELQNLELQNKSDSGAKTSDPAAQADKEKKLAELEKKKKNLEAALASLVQR